MLHGMFSAVHVGWWSSSKKPALGVHLLFVLSVHLPTDSVYDRSVTACATPSLLPAQRSWRLQKFVPMSRMLKTWDSLHAATAQLLPDPSNVNSSLSVYFPFPVTRCADRLAPVEP